MANQGPTFKVYSGIDSKPVFSLHRPLSSTGNENNAAILAQSLRAAKEEINQFLSALVTKSSMEGENGAQSGGASSPEDEDEEGDNNSKVHTKMKRSSSTVVDKAESKRTKIVSV